jgi:N-acetylmuramic acid 6-phosphate etherase
MKKRSSADPWSKLVTEAVNPRSRSLDTMSPPAIARLIADEDLRAIKAVRSASAVISRVAVDFAAAIRAGGRVLYLGAGTSGRLGVIDAAELVPTFGLPRRGKGSAVGRIAGGWRALRRSVEGAEDSIDAGRASVKDLRITSRDLVIGISASSLAPYVRAALEEAHARGARTALVTMNRIPRPGFVDHLIAVLVGPEVVAGSTRMKSGLATKSILHAISTTAMILCGKVHGNRMVDLKPWCSKLEARGARLIVEIGDVSPRIAGRILEASHGEVKAGIVMARHDCSLAEARKRLAAASGDLRRALAEPPLSGRRPQRSARSAGRNRH